MGATGGEELKKIRITRAVNNLISDIKKRTFPVDMVIAFGSIVRGDYNEYSDIDICVVCDEEVTNRQRLELEQYIREYLGHEIEADFVYCDIEKLRSGDRVFESIRKEGVVLYE